MKKPVYLLLALLLPILIFVFLKYAGKNEFNIPVYYEKDDVHPGPGCQGSYPKPYTVHNRQFLQPENWGDANVIVFAHPGLEVRALESRLYDELETEDVRVLDACQTTRDSTVCSQWRNCILFAKDPYQTVLFDKRGRIRGYYDLTLREEEDRLRVELKILLKKY